MRSQSETSVQTGAEFTYGWEYLSARQESKLMRRANKRTGEIRWLTPHSGLVSLAAFVVA
jgi:hypothetical protein